MMSGERISAAQAEAWGLVDLVVDDLDEGIERVAGTIAAQSPNAVRELKQLLRATRDGRTTASSSRLSPAACLRRRPRRHRGVPREARAELARALIPRGSAYDRADAVVDARVRPGTRRLLFIVAWAAALSIATWAVCAVRANAGAARHAAPAEPRRAEGGRSVDALSGRAKAAYQTASNAAGDLKDATAISRLHLNAQFDDAMTTLRTAIADCSPKKTTTRVTVAATTTFADSGVTLGRNDVAYVSATGTISDLAARTPPARGASPQTAAPPSKSPGLRRLRRAGRPSRRRRLPVPDRPAFDDPRPRKALPRHQRHQGRIRRQHRLVRGHDHRQVVSATAAGSRPRPPDRPRLGNPVAGHSPSAARRARGRARHTMR